MNRELFIRIISALLALCCALLAIIYGYWTSKISDLEHGQSALSQRILILETRQAAGKGE